MKIELTEQQYRYLLDLVYIGNWVLNSTREDDRIKEYDQVEVGDIIDCDRYVLEHSRMGTLDPGDIKANRGNWEQYPDDPFYKMMERYEAQTAQSPSPP